VMVSGDIYLGIDPFFYFERLYNIPGIPELIYTWKIEEIGIETAPFIEWPNPSIAGKYFIRDESKLRRVSIAQTDAWSDDDGNADYLLTCRLMDELPTRCLGQ
jgi:hypothetical protein